MGLSGSRRIVLVVLAAICWTSLLTSAMGLCAYGAGRLVPPNGRARSLRSKRRFFKLGPRAFD